MINSAYKLNLIPSGVIRGKTCFLGQGVVLDPDHFSIVFEADHIGYQQQLGFFLEGGGYLVGDRTEGVYEDDKNLGSAV